MMTFTGRSAVRTAAAIAVAMASAQVAQAAPVTVTTAPAGYSTYMDWNAYTLGQVDFATGTNQILGLTTSVDVKDQGYGGSDPTNGVLLRLIADGTQLWGAWVGGGGHDWTHQDYDITANQAQFADLNTALAGVDWSTTSSLSMVMSHRGWGYPGWALTTANATMTVTSDATSPVPEPATWAMLMFGFGGLGYAMRRREKTGVRIRFA